MKDELGSSKMGRHTLSHICEILNDLLCRHHDVKHSTGEDGERNGGVAQSHRNDRTDTTTILKIQAQSRVRILF